MKRSITPFLIILVILVTFGLLSSAVYAEISLSIEPPSETVIEGETFSLDLNILGLTEGGPDTLGAFELDITFDPDILGFDSVMFEGLLGNFVSGEAIIGVDSSTSGLVELDEVSLLFDSELDAIQPSTFTLATLNFDANSGGSSAIQLENVVLSDAFGIVLPVSNTSNGQLNVVSPAPIPEPSSLLLCFLGIFFVGYGWRLQAKHPQNHLG